MNAVTTLKDHAVAAVDPSGLGWPPTLAVEIALREQTVKEVCTAYGITRPEWLKIAAHPGFRKELEVAVNMLKTEGMSFKIKARLQSEHLLGESWRLIHHDDTPANVKADLIKFTVKAAGLDASKDQGHAVGGGGSAFQINIQLG